MGDDDHGELNAIGFTAEDLEFFGLTGDVEVWEPHWAAFMMFNRIKTQWRVSMGGVVGLDYNALYPLLDREAKDDKQWQDYFDDIRAIEEGALEALNEDKHGRS